MIQVSSPSFAPTIKHIESHRAMLLGDDDKIDDTLFEKIEEFQLLASRIKQLCAHDAFFLMKNCFSLPNAVHHATKAKFYEDTTTQSEKRYNSF